MDGEFSAPHGVSQDPGVPMLLRWSRCPSDVLCESGYHVRLSGSSAEPHHTVNGGRTTDSPVFAGVCGCSSMVEHQLPKLNTGVRFSVPALYRDPRHGGGLVVPGRRRLVDRVFDVAQMLHIPGKPAGCRGPLGSQLSMTWKTRRFQYMRSYCASPYGSRSPRSTREAIAFRFA